VEAVRWETWFALACGAATAAMIGTVSLLPGIIAGLVVALLMASILDVLDRDQTD
jgi:MFS superfamily sulfate permease-like transporter